MVSHILVEDLKDNGDEPSKMELNGPRRKSMVGERFTERIDNKVIMALLLWYFWSGQSVLAFSLNSGCQFNDCVFWSASIVDIKN